MNIDIYLNYAGTCEEAFRFYEKHLGGKVHSLMRHEDVPNPQIPKDFGRKVLHARLDLGGTAIMGADMPQAEPMRSAYVTMTVDTAAEAERIYELLTEGGQIFMKLEETFYAERFAMFRDRFGTSWMLLGAQKQR